MFKYLPLTSILFINVLNCTDPERPFPPVSRQGNSVDAGMVADSEITNNDTPRPPTPPTEATPIPISHNMYVCYCRFLVPNNCVWGCGTVGTQTFVNNEGYCDVGIREANICLPRSLNPRYTGRVATEEEVELDCRTRVEGILREGVRMAFNNCSGDYPNGGPCDIQYGCTAIRLNNQVLSFHDDSCNEECGRVPLQYGSDGLNLREASYIPAGNQVHCDGQENVDSELICGYLR